MTAQEYSDRFETIYHLRKYDDPTEEVSVVVPTANSNPVSESAAPVYRTAEWHEREAYDLVGIEYEGSRPAADPSAGDLARAFAVDGLQAESAADRDAERMRQPVARGPSRRERGGGHHVHQHGPHHPSTHGVLHLEVTLDGEQVADVEPDIGYIHRCEEQMCQRGTYRHQIMPYPDRWDWVGAGLLNEWAYARVIEDLTDIDVPAYAQVVRTMSAEMSRDIY